MYKYVHMDLRPYNVFGFSGWKKQITNEEE